MANQLEGLLKVVLGEIHIVLGAAPPRLSHRVIRGLQFSSPECRHENNFPS
jgi:hypothetical protein